MQVRDEALDRGATRIIAVWQQIAPGVARDVPWVQARRHATELVSGAPPRTRSSSMEQNPRATRAIASILREVERCCKKLITLWVSCRAALAGAGLDWEISGASPQLRFSPLPYAAWEAFEVLTLGGVHFASAQARSASGS
jgi:hypothetical protein